MIGYHFAPVRLRAGSIIEPGNFGRMLKHHLIVQTATGRFGVEMLLARELVFEMIRLQSYPAKPSRMTCCFLLPTRDDVEKYRQHAGQGVLHEVCLVDDQAPAHTASLSHCALPNGGPAILGIEAVAKAYWQAAPGRKEDANEILVSTALRIRACLE